MTGRRGMTAIDEMPAGRELDALVAEKVMGWRITAWNDGEPWGNREVFPPFEPINGIPADCDCISHSEAGEPPHYSTDIAAAWEVVEKMNVDYDVMVRQQRFKPDVWECYIVRNGPFGPYDRDFWEGRADTAPLAICRATLKTVNA